MSQDKVTEIVFSIKINIDFEFIDPKPEVDSELTKKELEELETDRQNQISFWNSKLKKENESYYSYLFNSHDIRYVRTDLNPEVLSEEEFILIERKTRIMKHYFIDKNGVSSLREFPLDRTVYRPIQVEYKLQTFNRDRKIIHGYNCFRTVVKEIICDDEFGIETFVYDMYVTDEIDLPFHILNTTLKPIIDSCPLEMTIYRKSKGNSFTQINAVKVLKRAKHELELPSKYE